MNTDKFSRFREIIAALRHPETGCPWDKEQTHESLRSYLIEECYEAVEAIDTKNPELLKEELGDVLLQVVLNAQVAEDHQHFNIDDVIEYVTNKMIRRHPHVFGELKVENSKEVLKNWEEIKKAEKKNDKDLKSTPFDNIPKSLSALLVSERIGEKAARVKFDWDHISGVLEKINEEYKELFDALDETKLGLLNNPLSTPADSLPNHSKEALNQHKEVGKELGDCLFILTQLARWLGFSSESLLRETNTRFVARYKRMTELLKEDMTNEEIQLSWKKAKE